MTMQRRPPLSSHNARQKYSDRAKKNLFILLKNYFQPEAQVLLWGSNNGG